MCLRCGAAEEQESAVAHGGVEICGTRSPSREGQAFAQVPCPRCSEHGIALQGGRVPVMVTRDPPRADAHVRKTPFQRVAG
jgi:hypothetical protein